MPWKKANPLYHWTKSVVQDPDKQIKHSKSFAFYFGDEQIYEKERAISLYNDLIEFNDKNQIEEIKMIDSNPRNNPQPPRIKTNLWNIGSELFNFNYPRTRMGPKLYTW